MRAEMRVTSGLKIGADVSAESAALEEIVAQVKSYHYSGVETAIDGVISKVDAKTQLIAESALAEAARLFESYSGPIHISAYRAVLDQANEALKAGNWYKTYDSPPAH